MTRGDEHTAQRLQACRPILKAIKSFWSLPGLILMACVTPGYGPETSYIHVKRLLPSADSPSLAGGTYQVILGPKESRQAAREADEQTKGLPGEEFMKAWQETSRRLAEQELRRRGLCRAEVEIARRVLRLDRSQDTEIIVRCASA